MQSSYSRDLALFKRYNVTIVDSCKLLRQFTLGKCQPQLTVEELGREVRVTAFTSSPISGKIGCFVLRLVTWCVGELGAFV